MSTRHKFICPRRSPTAGHHQKSAAAENNATAGHCQKYAAPQGVMAEELGVIVVNGEVWVSRWLQWSGYSVRWGWIYCSGSKDSGRHLLVY